MKYQPVNNEASRAMLEHCKEAKREGRAFSFYLWVSGWVRHG